MGTPDWDDVRYFVEVARRGSFAGAARALGAQQSTLSRRVAALEAALGSAVFDRTAAGLELTALGQRVLQHGLTAERAMVGVGDAAAGAARTVTGVVRLALTETVATVFVMPRVLPELLRRHPGLSIDLVTSDEAADLARREADVAIRFFLPPRGELVAKRVARLQTAPMAERSVARRLARVPPAEWPWIGVSRSGTPSVEEQWLARLAPTPRLTTSSFHAQYEATRAGLGVAILPLTLRLADPGLEPLALPGLPSLPVIELYLVVPRALRKVPRVAAVFDALAAEFERATRTSSTAS